MHALGITDFGLFCLAVFLLNLTPGPDTAFIVGRSVAQGRAAGLVSALGISAGCCVHTLAMACGLSALLAASASAFTLIKLAGGAYLVYLGLRMLLQRAGTPHQAGPRSAPLPLPAVFWQAVLTNVMNPKVILFFLSFFPQFVTPGAPHQAWAFLALGATFIGMSTLWNGFTALVAGTLAARAGQRPRFRLWAERLVGGAFVALGLRLVLSKH